MNHDYYKIMLYNIINTMPYGIFMKDINLHFLGCNKFFLQGTGLESLDDIIGKSDFELPWPQELAEAYRKDDFNIINTRTPKENFLELQKLFTGEEIINLVSKWPLIDDNDEVIGIFGVCSRLTNAYPLIIDDKEGNYTFSIQTNGLNIHFSKKETKIIYHLIRGKSAQVIADELNISNRTVESYIENIKNKMMVNKKSEIIEYIIELILAHPSYPK